MTAPGLPQPAVGVGGPLDGTVLGVTAAEQVEVRMADGTRHLYVRAFRRAPDAQPYDYAGRR